jgi:hypothetical protein
MERFFKFLLVVAGLCLGFAAYSYLGARMTVGQLLGTESPLSERTIQFQYHGVQQLPGHPRAWVFTYRRTELPGVGVAQFFVSFNAQIIATRPPDLRQRIDKWQKARMP